MVGRSDTDQLARGIFWNAGFVSCEPSGVGALAVAIFGATRVTYTAGGQLEPFVLLRNPDRISLRWDLDERDVTIALGRAIARWCFEGSGRQMSDREVEDLAVALVLPERAFRDAIERYGYDAERIAHEFVCRREIAAKRIRRLFSNTSSGVFLRLVASA